MNSMLAVGLTQRLMPPDRHGERRLALDIRWNAFLAACGLLPVPLPLDPRWADAVIDRCACVGVVLTGGNDLADFGGDAPERDRLENHLLQRALAEGTPLLGVCRGMQVLLRAYGAKFERVAGHVATQHVLTGEYAGRVVNSYHRWGCSEVPPPFEVTACCGPVIEAVRLPHTHIAGIMWHPERVDPPTRTDIDLFTDLFRKGN
ncbi:gamma-glutamyl-gamma-aminobutyrate hydrolase family protein [Streptomyces rimosus]|uniref:gamma-glutamyl-gamma-aminobutyrate hydrolase family protein n=1 Tax=Streptomyces rimosus TaxID=1927 RepID=UPI0037CE0B0A